MEQTEPSRCVIFKLTQSSHAGIQTPARIVVPHCLSVLSDSRGSFKQFGNAEPEGNLFPSDGETKDAETLYQAPQYFDE